MKHILFLILFIFISQNIVFSQSWTNNQLIAANTAANAPGLSTEEKNVILYLNLARLYPFDFANIELKAHYGDRYNNSSSLNSYESGLKSELLTMSSLHAITYSSEMYRLAKCFSDETARNGTIGHTRMNCSNGWSGECCSYGYSSGKSIILQLLIDDGVSSLGHRRICLSSNYFSMGPSINTHSKYSNCCVLDFTTSTGVNYSASTAPSIATTGIKTTNNPVSTGSNGGNGSVKTSTSNFQSENEIIELKNKVSKLNIELSEHEKTITYFKRENSTLNNSIITLQQQKNDKESQYNKLSYEYNILSDRRTTVKKSKYNADEFHALTFKIGLNTFYSSIRDGQFGKFDPSFLSFGAESMIGFNFGESYRRNSIGITLRANQANRMLTNSLDSNATQAIQFYDAELTTLIREWLSIGLGANLITSYGSPSYQINPSVSLGLCLGPKNWKIQINQQATMNSDKKISGRASLGLALRL
jgi:hypothetical protein